jgi:hypothetical protein
MMATTIRFFVNAVHGSPRQFFDFLFMVISNTWSGGSPLNLSMILRMPYSFLSDYLLTNLIGSIGLHKLIDTVSNWFYHTLLKAGATLEILDDWGQNEDNYSAVFFNSTWGIRGYLRWHDSSTGTIYNSSHLQWSHISLLGHISCWIMAYRLKSSNSPRIPPEILSSSVDTLLAFR